MDYQKWMENIKELNAGQPSILDLVQQQIDAYENEKALCTRGSNALSKSSINE